MHRVLKPGGEAIIMLYNRYSWFYLAHLLSGTNIEHADKDAPVIRVYSTKECRRLFSAFESVEIHVDRFPKPTVKWKTLAARINNYVLVPLFQVMPAMIKRPLGWHIMIRARK